MGSAFSPSCRVPPPAAISFQTAKSDAQAAKRTLLSADAKLAAARTQLDSAQDTMKQAETALVAAHVAERDAVSARTAAADQEKAACDVLSAAERELMRQTNEAPSCGEGDLVSEDGTSTTSITRNPVESLHVLKQMFDAGLISETDFLRNKERILTSLT